MQRPVVLQPQLKVLLVAVSCGFAAGILALLGWLNLAPSPPSQEGAIRLAALCVGVSAIAGMMTSFALPWSNLGADRMLGTAIRAGLVSGLISTLITSASILVVMTFRAFEAPTRAGDLYFRVLAWHALTVLIAVIFSSIPAGIAGSLVGLASRMPGLAKPILGMFFGTNQLALPGEERITSWPVWMTRAIIAFSVLGILSPFLFFLLPPKTDQPSQPISPPAEAPIALPQPSVPAPARFSYVEPKNFETAEAGQFSIFAREGLPRAIQDRPMVFSSDSKLFAYCPESSGKGPTVTVWDLHAHKIIAVFRFPALPTQLTWSPDSQKLFYTSEGGVVRSMGVLNLQTQANTMLPYPKNRDLPGGSIAWLEQNLVSFYPPNDVPLSLDLNSLRLQPLEETESYKSADERTRKKYLAGLEFDMPKRLGWEMLLTPTIQAIYPAPRQQANKSWESQIYMTLSFRDAAHQVVQPISKIALEPGHLLLPSPDGTKLFHQSEHEVEMIYFTTESTSPPSLISVKMPLAHDQAMPPERLASFLDGHRLCAFVYAPLINPLTGKTVGPDRERVHALVRLLSWKDGDKAELWIAERYVECQSGDVVADFHTWNEGVMKPIIDWSDSRWWYALESGPHGNRRIVPNLAKAPALEMGWEVKLEKAPYAFICNEPSRRYFEKPQSITPVPEATQLPTFSSPEKPNQDGVRSFVRTHHRNASAGDVYRFADNYADRVVRFGKNTTRNEIFNEETIYHEKWDKVEENILGDIIISGEREIFLVRYTVNFYTASSKTGRWMSGKSDITLSILPTKSGLKIFSESVRIYDKNEG
jgi:hypothetical protein